MTERLNRMEIQSADLIRELKEKRYSPEVFGLDQKQAVVLLADKIAAIEKPDTKVISLVGGAGSGKTTLTMDILSELGRRGFTADFMGTDAFSTGTREQRHALEVQGVNPLEKYDFKALESLIEKIKNNSENEVVPVPTYDDQTGLAIAAGEENFVHKIGKVDFLVVEGDMDPVENPDLRIYMHVPDEIRLQNRINRDKQKRGEADEQKIAASFNHRQNSQHLPLTLPAARRADVMLDIQNEDGEYKYDVYKKQPR